MTNAGRNRGSASAASLGLITALFGTVALHAEETATYQYYVVGNPENVERNTEGLIVMQGGGDDVDANFTRMGEKSGGGDFVVSRASGAAKVFASADHETPFVYFIRTSGNPEVCVVGEPLTFRNIEVYRIGSDGSFDVEKWKGEGGIRYTLDAVNGQLLSSRDSIY